LFVALFTQVLLIHAVRPQVNRFELKFKSESVSVNMINVKNITLFLIYCHKSNRVGQGWKKGVESVALH